MALLSSVLSLKQSCLIPCRVKNVRNKRCGRSINSDPRKDQLHSHKSPAYYWRNSRVATGVGQDLPSSLVSYSSFPTSSKSRPEATSRTTSGYFIPHTRYNPLLLKIKQILGQPSSTAFNTILYSNCKVNCISFPFLSKNVIVYPRYFKYKQFWPRFIVFVCLQNCVVLMSHV